MIHSPILEKVFLLDDFLLDNNDDRLIRESFQTVSILENSNFLFSYVPESFEFGV